MNPALALALAAVLILSVALALRARSGRHAAAVGLFGAAAALGLLRQLALASALAAMGLGLWRSGGPGSRSTPAPGRRSDVRTAGLSMTLDHDSGDMDGEVLAGPHAGRWVSELDKVALRELVAQFSADPDSRALLQAYLDRAGLELDEPAPPDADTPMSAEEAYSVLGLEPGASGSEVRAAYRRLIRRVHPDLGGSSALAAMLNRARQVLDPGGTKDGA